jgi:hypothetical protein
MDLFFKMMKNDKLAEAYNNYSQGLLALIEHQPKKALEPFFRAYAYYVEKDENVFFEALKEDYKWLKNYGCSYTDLMIIYNQVVAEHQQTEDELKKLRGQGINCRRENGVFDSSTFLIIPISRRDKSAENLFATLFPFLIQTG